LDTGAVNVSDVLTLDITGVVGAGIAGMTITNTMSLTNMPITDINASNNSASVDLLVYPSADLTVDITDTPDPVNQTQPITYVFTARNTSPDAAATVIVDNTFSGTAFTILSVTPSQGSCVGFPCDLGILPANTNATITVLVQADGAGTLTAAATISSPTFDPNGGNNTDSISTTINPVADLNITSSDNPDPVSQLGTVTYSFTITNAGPSAADNVTVNHTLGGVGALITSVTSSQGGCTVFPCNVGTINAGNNATITLTLQATTAGNFTSAASVTTSTVELNTGDNSATNDTTVTPVADVGLSMADAPDPITVGQNVVYTFTVTNSGVVSAADNVTVSYTVGGVGATEISVTSSQGGCTGFPCNVGTLNAGNSATITLTLQAGATAGTLTVNANVTTTTPDINSGNDTAAGDTTVN
jgi:uncharacterized repeat protein (TIGR01451 family)